MTLAITITHLPGGAICHGDLLEGAAWDMQLAIPDILYEDTPRQIIGSIHLLPSCVIAGLTAEQLVEWARPMMGYCPHEFGWKLRLMAA